MNQDEVPPKSLGPNRRSDPVESFLLLPVERDRALQDPMQGELWRCGAVADRNLYPGRKEGEGCAGPDEGIVVSGLACDPGERGSGPQRRDPSMRIGQRAEQHRVGFGLWRARHQLRLDAAAAEMNHCR